MSIANPFRTDTSNRIDPSIQPTILHFEQATGAEHSDRNHFPLSSLDSGTDVPKSS